MLGKVSTEWRREEDDVTFTVNVPAMRQRWSCRWGVKALDEGAAGGGDDFVMLRGRIGVVAGRTEVEADLYQGFERATAMPRTSLGYLPETAQ